LLAESAATWRTSKRFLAPQPKCGKTKLEVWKAQVQQTTHLQQAAAQDQKIREVHPF